MPSCWRSARPSSSVLAVVTKVMFSPLIDVDPVVVDLGEDDLLLEAERVVALAVERLARDALKSRMRGSASVIEAVEELPHARAAQRDHRADGEALAELEVRDRLLGARDDRLLAGDRASSSTAASMIFGFATAAPRPMLTTIF